MLKIAGYEDVPLVDGSRFLDLPLFWPCHLGSSLWGEEAQAIAFGPDWDDAQELYKTLSCPDEWPAFTVHLHSGYALHVIYRNLEGEHGIDYLLSHPAWTEAVTLATDDGHFMGPGLSWPELEASADQGSTSGVTDPNARLLLLFPMLGDADVPEAAVPRLASALAELTIVEDTAEVARVLLENQGQWTPASWREADGTWICDGSHSFRNPENHFALPAPRLAAASSALLRR
ncbi:hypothetical protein LK07_10140 [Streptomyces pluripotens]|uniref:Uncharacterized protein n=1 Tax=Streptomyces pluripotens TaxID=1355015 RepID=A0A221NWH3_9ACTN|nr:MULTISPECIES: hypothetical protein [Streptomyces]ARP70088.1 hypothetical protein LK06_009030 [Streptomyces pluripotens]ASN24349.1 hypothetical protein LK07_10140 [Streptomyces pluripotens]MCH0561305.1 hypothetical protein [Streptomyces sp. MUM 16J]